MFIEKLPEIAQAVSAPLSKVDKIVMVNTGGGDGVGASRLTSEVTNIIAQVPPVIEAMTGIKLHDLMSKVPGMGAPPIDVSPSNGATPTTETAPASRDGGEGNPA
jgi:flotillin